MVRSLLALLAVVVLLGGCDDGNAGLQESIASTVDTALSNPTDERFCELARSYIEQSTGRTSRDVRSFGESLEASQGIVMEMQEVAPEEIVADVVRLGEVLAVVVPALEEAEFNLSQVSPEVLQRLQDPEFQASAERLQEYTESACGPV